MNIKKILRDNKWYILALVGILIVYTITRLYNIMSLPMFTDEAIYTRWSQIAHNDPDWWFISLTDGKQPLFIWADALLMHLVDDPLAAGRLMSVLTGLGATIVLYFLGREIFRSKKVGLVCAAFYVLFPFALVYDRMALYDAMVTFFFALGLLFTVILVRRGRILDAVTLGVTAGFGALNKTSGFLTIYLLPFALIFFDFNKKARKKRLVRLVIFGGLAAVIMFMMYSSLRISPFFYIISQKNDTFIYPLSEWIQHPFTYLLSNFHSVSSWTVTYVSVPILLLALSSLFVKREHTREKIYLLAVFLALEAVPIVFGRVIFPRYLFFMTIPLVVLAAYALVLWGQKIKNKLLFALLAGVVVFIWVRADYYILTDFARAPIPESDLNQYANSWPAGGGYRELIEFVEKESKNKEIFVATEGTFGSLPTYTIEIYHGENKNVEKQGYYPLPPQIPQELLTKAEEMPVYFVFNETQSPPENAWPIELVEEYPKGIGNEYMRIYRVVPQDE